MGREQGPRSPEIHVPPIEQYSPVEIEALAERTHGHAALPFTMTGEVHTKLQPLAVKKNYPDDTPSAQATIMQAARQVHDWAGGNETRPMPKFTGDRPNISRLRFLPELFNLPTDKERMNALVTRTQGMTEDDIRQTITNLATFLSLTNGRRYFAPFYTGDTLDTQLDVTAHIATLRTKALTGEDIEILPPDQRAVVTVIKDFVRGKRLPTFVAAKCVVPEPGTQALPDNDHDSGNCDTIFNEANYLGEQGVILARSGKFVLLQTPDSHAWVPENAVKADEIVDLSVNNILATPQVLLDTFIENTNGEAYTWGHRDCSSKQSEAAREVLQRQLGKFTGDIMQRVIDVVGEEHMQIMDKGDKLDLENGMYFMDLGRITERTTDKGEIIREFSGSTHMWLCVVSTDRNKRKIYRAFSVAFQLLNEKGETESPIGLHEANAPMLQGYLERGRALRAVKMTEPHKRHKQISEPTEDSIYTEPNYFHVITPDEVAAYKENLSRFGIAADSVPVHILQPGDPLFNFYEYGDKLFRKYPENTPERTNIRVLFSANFLELDMRLRVIGEMAEAAGIELDGTMPGFAQANTEGQIHFFAMREDQIIPMARAYAIKEGKTILPETQDEAMSFLRGMAETTFYHEVAHTIHVQLPEDEREAWDRFAASDPTIVQRIQFLQEDKYNDPDKVPVGAEAFAEIFVNLVDPQGRKGRLGENLEAEEKMKAILTRTNPNFNKPEE